MNHLTLTFLLSAHKSVLPHRVPGSSDRGPASAAVSGRSALPALPSAAGGSSATAKRNRDDSAPAAAVGSGGGSASGSSAGTHCWGLAGLALSFEDGGAYYVPLHENPVYEAMQPAAFALLADPKLHKVGGWVGAWCCSH